MNDPPALAADSPAAERARRLDRLCDHFEAAWKAGRPPSLERYLDNVPHSAQPELLRELLVLELDYRGQRGEKPQREEYRLRFPEHGELIDTVFGEARPSASSTPSLLRRWSVNRLAHELRKSLFPAERHGAPGVEGGAQSAGSSVSGSSPPAQIFSLLARLLGAGSVDPAGASSSPDAGINPMLQPGNGCRPEGGVASVYGLPTQLLEPGKLPNGGASGKECPAGTVLGDYELLERLGKGGMGIVYRARQRSANRIVALKVIRPDRLEELTTQECQEWFERFRREGQIAACVEDEHLVTVYEVGQAGGQLFYSMRYVEGQSLAEILRKGPLPNQRSALYMEHVAQALHVLHLRGTVHRDVKPRNILVDTKDRPFLTDYGLAKSSAYSQGLTQFGSCMGTPEYMSPEQARDSAAAGAASDIYSLGATLYELLTGRPPFRAADPLETLRQVQDDEPLSPRRLNPAVHRDLELICLKCLQKEPQKRYATALEAAEELHRYHAGEPLVHTRSVTKAERVWRWCRRKPLQAASVVLATLALTAATALTITLAFNVQLRQEKADTLAALEQAGRLANQVNTLQALERGQELCQKGDVARGTLWLARSLELAQPDQPDRADLDRVIRTNLDGWSRRLNPLQAILPHDKDVLAVAFSRDSRTILTATRTTVQLWEAATGKRVGEYSVPGDVRDAALSPDGKKFLTAGQDNIARLWDASTGQVLVLPHGREVVAVAFSPDGKIVATGSRDETARLWNAASGLPIGDRLQHQGTVCRLAFSRDGERLVTGSCRRPPRKDGGIRVWDVAKCQPLCQPIPIKGRVLAVAFNPDSKRVLTVSAEETAAGTSVGIARLWDMGTQKSIGQPLRLQGEVETAAISPDAKWVQVGINGNKTAQVWDVGWRRPIGPPLHHRDQITCQAFSPDGKFIVTGSRDQTARLWRTASKAGERFSFAHRGPIQAVAFSRDGKSVVTGGQDGFAQIWDTDTGAPRGRRLVHQRMIRAVAFSPDGKMVLTASDDWTACLWDAATGGLLHLLPHPKGACAAAFSPDSKTVLTGCGDGSVWLWNSQTGQRIGQLLKQQRIGQLLKHTMTIFSVAFSSDGKRIVTASEDGSAQVWDTATRQPISPPLGHKQAVLTAVFNSDGRFVLTGSADNTARLWDAVTGDPLSPDLRHDGRVWSVAFSPDDKWILTGSEDMTARIWEIGTDRLRCKPLQHQGIVRRVAFSPDGRLVLTASDDKTARFWDAATGRQCGPSLQHQGMVAIAIFSPDGNLVISAGTDKKARLWEVPVPESGTVHRIGWQTRVNTGMMLDETGTTHVLDWPSWHGDRQHLDENAEISGRANHTGLYGAN